MRLIDADALREKAWDADTRCGYVQVVDVGDIDEAPTIEAEPVKHGEWRIGERDMDERTMLVECSECDALFELSMIAFGLNYNYCPNCGAKMDLEGEGCDIE